MLYTLYMDAACVLYRVAAYVLYMHAAYMVILDAAYVLYAVYAMLVLRKLYSRYVIFLLTFFS